MVIYRCVKRCFRDGRLYEPGDVLKGDGSKIPHFEPLEPQSKPVRAPAAKPPPKKKPKSRKTDILE